MKGQLPQKKIQLVWRCVRPRHKCLYASPLGGSVVFTSHLKKWRRLFLGHSSPTDFCSVSVQPPTFLSTELLFAAGLHAPQCSRPVCYTFSLFGLLSYSLSSFTLPLSVSASKHSGTRRREKSRFSIRLVAVKLNQKENHFDR